MHWILIVDDEKIERNYLKSIINKYPSKYLLVGEASNGEQAKRIAFDKKPDVIIMDITMPLLDGLQASKAIKSKYESTVIILNSAYSEFEFAQKAVNYNLDAYLLKPASEEAIIETIESSLHKNKYHGETGLDQDFGKSTYNWNYPYSIVDKIVDSVLIKDLDLLENSTDEYINYLRTVTANVNEYKLFIINTVFVLIRTLTKILNKEDIKILESKGYLCKLSQAQYWHEILYNTEGFFELMLALLKNNYFYYTSLANQLASYIDDNYKNDISLELLSELFHFSPAHISRKFHQEKGCTINEYVRNKRINHAIYLLENSTITIGNISSMSGFSNISHFNRIFKSTTGKVPSEYRKKEDL